MSNELELRLMAIRSAAAEQRMRETGALTGQVGM